MENSETHVGPVPCPPGANSGACPLSQWGLSPWDHSRHVSVPAFPAAAGGGHQRRDTSPRGNSHHPGPVGGSGQEEEEEEQAWLRRTCDRDRKTEPPRVHPSLTLPLLPLFGMGGGGVTTATFLD